MIEAYVQTLLEAISQLPIVSASNVTLDKRAPQIGFIRGDLHFINGSQLHFRELVEAKGNVMRRMYSYHYQDAATTLIFRYDDTPHHPGLRTLPHHKHDGSETNVIETRPPDLFAVLREIQALHPLSY